MKIAFIKSGMVQGGGERVAAVLSEEFIKKGHEVTIIIIGENKEIAFKLNPKIKIVFLKEWLERHQFKRTTFQLYKNRIKKMIVKQTNAEIMFRDYCFGSEQLSYYLNNNPVDYAIGLLVHENMTLALCSKKQKAKTIISEGTFPERPDYDNSFKIVRNKCYAHSDFCVFQTEEQATYFPRKIYKKRCVIANPISDDLPNPYYGKRNNTIVNFCRLDRPKNLFLLLDAFFMIVVENPDYQLKIYGDGPLYNQVNDYIDKLNLKNKAFLYPFDENLHDKIKDSAMFVTSSDYEGLSNSLMEAMAMGMPVIATDCLGGGARSLIKDRENGLLVPRGNKEQLYLAIKEYINNSELAEKCGRNAKRIRDDYSVKKIAEKWLRLMK